MTRADSIAAGLLIVPTADGSWDDNGTYGLDGKPVQGIGVGGTDTEAETDENGNAWGD